MTSLQVSGKEIINEAKHFFLSGKIALDNKWWSNKARDVLEFISTDREISEIYEFCEDVSKSGFDCRIMGECNDIIQEKLRCLKRQFKDYHLGRGEPEFISLAGINGIKLINGVRVSNSYLNMQHYYYSIVSSLDAPPGVIFEIGAGNGSLARVFKQNHAKLKYVICDIPTSLFFQYCHLKAAFPLAKFEVFRSHEAQSDDFDFLFIKNDDIESYKDSELCKRLGIDFLINTASFQEMSNLEYANYTKIILNDLMPRNIYSFNYFLTNVSIPGKVVQERSSEEANVPPFIPIYNREYRIKHIKYNPEGITADRCGRNHLEVILTRDAVPRKKNSSILEIVNLRKNSHGLSEAMDNFMQDQIRYAEELERELDELWFNSPNLLFSGKFGSPFGPSDKGKFINVLKGHVPEFIYLGSVRNSV